MLGELVSSGAIGLVAGQIQNVVTSVFKLWGENQRLLAGIKNEARIVKESAKFDTNKDNQLVRRFITFSIIGTICYVMVYVITYNPELVTNELVKRSPGILGWITGSTGIKVIQKAFVENFNQFMNYGGLIIGYYMSRIRNVK